MVKKKNYDGTKYPVIMSLYKSAFRRKSKQEVMKMCNTFWNLNKMNDDVIDAKIEELKRRTSVILNTNPVLDCFRKSTKQSLEASCSSSHGQNTATTSCSPKPEPEESSQDIGQHEETLQARYAFIKSPEASEVVTVTNFSSQPAMIQDGNENLRQDRKRLSSEIVATTKTLERDDKSPGGPLKKSRRGSFRSKESERRKSLLDIKQTKNSTPRKSRRCRFCRHSGHATWFCKSNAEYYEVGLTVEGRNPRGCLWPKSSIIKVEGLHAGPIIEYIEREHLEFEEMNREEIRIMFAWLTNYYVCHTCGAAGHMENAGLCKYLPLKHPETEEIMAQVRRPFCKRMSDIRDKLSFGGLQQYACIENNNFRAWMEVNDAPPNSEKWEAEHSKTLQRDPFAEPRNGERNHSGASGSFFLASDGKRIKIES